MARRGDMEAQQLRAAANARFGARCRHHQSGNGAAAGSPAASGPAGPAALRVHDELVLEVAPDALDTPELVVQTMEQAVALSVPSVVETGVGANWMEAK